MKIYVVTSGEYSDYRIEAVFTDKKMADDFVTESNSMKNRWDEAEIEEYEVDKPKPEWHGWLIRMNREGKVLEKEAGFNESPEYGFDFRGNLYCIVNGSEERAIKVTNERRVQLIAENKWPSSK